MSRKHGLSNHGLNIDFARLESADAAGFSVWNLDLDICVTNVAT